MATTIEPVTMDQEHFRVPTLRTDARGLVIGDRGLLRFNILPQVVSFFQALTQEQSLDHLASSLRILKVRSRTAGLELVVDLPSQGSYLMDRAAAIARLLRGDAYTGAWPHFVPYRDRSAPFGYDATSLDTYQEGAVLYNKYGKQLLELTGEMSFEALLLDLSLDRTEPGPIKNCVLSVPVGLRRPLQSFLWRRKITTRIAEVVREPDTKFARAEMRYLFELPDPPESLRAFFAGVPGLEVYQRHGPNVLVERGWSHPLAIENCRRYFSKENLYFFSGTRDRVDKVRADGLTFVELADLDAQDFRFSVAGEIRETQTLIGRPDASYRGQPLGGALEYRVSLVEIPGPNVEHISAKLITDPREIMWLKRIVYSLPQAALNDYRAAFTDHGVLIVNPKGVEWIPLGIPLKEVFSGVYIPTSHKFVPPIGYEHLAKSINIRRGALTIIQDMAQPIEVPEVYLKPLVRYLLADVELQEVESLAPSLDGDDQGIPLKSAEAGLFSLWKQNLFKPSITDPAKGALKGEP